MLHLLFGFLMQLALTVVSFFAVVSIVSAFAIELTVPVPITAAASAATNAIVFSWLITSFIESSIFDSARQAEKYLLEKFNPNAYSKDILR